MRGFATAFMLISGALPPLAIVAAALLFELGTALMGRRRRVVLRTLRAALLLLPVSLLVTGPLILASLAVHGQRTRGDEAFYSGPRVDEHGVWHAQSPRGRGEAPAGAAAEPPADGPFTVRMQAADGVVLRGFLVAPPGTPRFAAVVVHGLFRGGLEIEPPGAMLRDLGGAVLLLELRNHGGSGEARATFGRGEALDVAAAVAFLRAHAEVGRLPIVLFGVSLGAAAVCHALPDLDGVAAVVLDSPIADLDDTAERTLRDKIGLVEPFRALTVAFVERLEGATLEELGPLPALRRTRGAWPALVVVGAADTQTPGSAAQAVVAALRIARPHEATSLWVVPGASHGKAWRVAPEAYRERLAALLAQARISPAPPKPGR